VTQAILATGSRASLRIVTRNGSAAGEANVDPWQSAPSGFVLSAAIEHPELQPSIIDLPALPKHNEAEELASELINGGEAVCVALRGERLVAQIEPCPLPPLINSSLRHDATYLIPGGLGSLGLSAAERMVRDGARHLVLAGRTAAGSPAIDALRAAGASITIAACDFADMDSVDRLFNEILPTLPPLRGVIYTAGVTEDALLANQTAAGFRRVMAAKISGAWNLHQRTAALPLDFFVLYSSAASLIGSGGQANYAAANSFLDALAHRRRALGLPAVSLNWGAWSGSGMAAREEVLERLKAQGVGTISPDDGLDLLSAVLSGGEFPAQLGVFPAQWTTYVPKLPQRLRSRLAPLCPDELAPQSSGILEALAGLASAEDRYEALRTYTRGVLARVLGYKSANELGAPQNFFEMGMDSLTAVEFRNRLQEDLRIPLPATLAFDSPNIEALAHFLEETLTPQSPLADDAASMSQPEWNDLGERAELDGLTSDELAQLLVEAIGEGGQHVR
jgi:short-subunit dehydrogenase/acyl carrier protein